MTPPVFPKLTTLPPPTRTTAHLGPLPSYTEASQPPIRNRPFSTIRTHPFNRSASLILPTALWTAISPRLVQSPSPSYVPSLTLTLPELLSDQFLTFALQDDVELAMLSEGAVGESDVFALQGRVLSLCLDQEGYEGCGLVGRRMRGAGKAPRKGERGSWRIDVKLDEMVMTTGKKLLKRTREAVARVEGGRAFDWQVTAWRRTATGKLTNEGTEELWDEIKGALLEGKEINDITLVEHISAELGSTILPLLALPDDGGPVDPDEFNSYADGLLDFISLCNLQSPLLRPGSLDQSPLGWELPEPGGPQPLTSSVTLVRWSGLLPAPWIANLFQELINATAWWRSQLKDDPWRGAVCWFALSVAGVERSPISWAGPHEEKPLPGEDGYAIMKMPDRDECISWEVVGHADSHH